MLCAKFRTLRASSPCAALRIDQKNFKLWKPFPCRWFLWGVCSVFVILQCTAHWSTCASNSALCVSAQSVQLWSPLKETRHWKCTLEHRAIWCANYRHLPAHSATVGLKELLQRSRPQKGAKCLPMVVELQWAHPPSKLCSQTHHDKSYISLRDQVFTGLVSRGLKSPSWRSWADN